MSTLLVFLCFLASAFAYADVGTESYYIELSIWPQSGHCGLVGFNDCRYSWENPINWTPEVRRNNEIWVTCGTNRSRNRGAPLPGTLSSVGGNGEESPPIYRPGSQAYVVSQFVKPKPPHQYWEEETSLTLVPDNKNCLLCEQQDSGACRAMPSCVYCEPTVTALCERSTPCLRCTVIKNPFFKCIPGEKYMDECDSCRCTDGHSGWCTNQFCEFRSLHIYAAKLSDGEFY